MDSAPLLHDDHQDDQGRRDAPPSCPCCGGALFPCRGAVQCGRCHFRLCEGCQGAEDPLELEGGGW